MRRGKSVELQSLANEQQQKSFKLKQKVNLHGYLRCEKNSESHLQSLQDCNILNRLIFFFFLKRMKKKKN